MLTKIKANCKILSILPALSIMIAIFYFSSQDAVESSGLSNGVVESIIDGLEHSWKMNPTVFHNQIFLEVCETVIRKMAHMTEYALLAISVNFSFHIYGRRKHRLFVSSEIVCILYAMTDEFHQLFIPGRAGLITDVLIDGTGALIGCFVVAFFLYKVTLNHKKS